MANTWPPSDAPQPHSPVPPPAPPPPSAPAWGQPPSTPTPPPTAAGWGQPTDTQPAYPLQQPGYQQQQPGYYPPIVPAAPTKKTGYIAAALIILLGTFAALVMIGVGASNSGVDKLPTEVPASGNVSIAKPGTYSVYEISSDGADTANATDTSVNDPSGRTVAITATSIDTTTRSHGRTARQIGTFKVDTTGTYHVSSSTISPSSTLGVGRPVSWTGIGLLIGGFALGGFAWFVGIITLIVTAIKHSRSRKNIAY